MHAILSTPALEAMRRSIESAIPVISVAQALERVALYPHYQPIVQLSDGVVVAHESLIRGPADSPLQYPDALFASARVEGLLMELEQQCVREGIRAWSTHELGSRLFVNLSANALIELLQSLTLAGLLAALRSASIAPASIVVEITESERVLDMNALIVAFKDLRREGVQFALDDFGDGRSSLRLWAELRPEIVKIDKYFVKSLPTEAIKVQTLKGLIRFAETFGTVLVAEGIETADELKIVRDLGIELGQGFFLGRPAALPAKSIPPAANAVLASSVIAVLPEPSRAGGSDFTVDRLSSPVSPIAPEVLIDEVASLFARDEMLRAVAVVDNGVPVGLLNRQALLNQYSKQYFKELYGRKPCLLFANTSPLLLDKRTGLDALTAVLTSSDQRYLVEGFIVTEGGRYVGLGTGEQLVRVVTESRMEAARHANPLTFLPGNIPISEHIQRLISSRSDFVACYGDLNDFKPFNDHYGYWRGDEMIRLVARTIIAHADARRDFVGHVGGDDFVILFQSEDWMERCEQIIAAFNRGATSLFDEPALARGGIEAEDRHGILRFFKFTTLSIGAVRITAGQYSTPEQVASSAAAAKHRAKMTSAGLLVEDGRSTEQVNEFRSSTLKAAHLTLI